MYIYGKNGSMARLDKGGLLGSTAAFLFKMKISNQRKGKERM